MYSLRLEMYARADPLVISAEDLLADHVAEMDKILHQMKKIDPAEAADQVHESYLFDLCSRCRNRMHHQLKARKNAEQEL